MNENHKAKIKNKISKFMKSNISKLTKIGKINDNEAEFEDTIKEGK